jgi:hypothetical protein
MVSFLFPKEQIFEKENLDTLTNCSKNRMAFVQALGVNGNLWIYNRYIANEHWAKISIQSFKNNIEHGWVIDEDRFDINQFGHPYQGALVYTAARAQGLEFWQSIPYPILSSYIWEMGLETEYPSINDMITTPMSGVTYGEISHRLSELILGNNPTIANEIVAFVVNPSMGLNRLFRGKSYYQIDNLVSLDYDAGISVGAGGFLMDENTLLFPHRFVRFHIFYGNPFDKNSITKPFDYFSFVGIINFGKEEFIGEVYSSGLLKKLNINTNSEYSQLLGIFQNYDFMNHDDFKVSSSSIGLGLIQNFNLPYNLTFFNEISTSAIILGSAGDTSDDINYIKDYYYGPGVSGKIILKLKKENYGNIYLRLKRYYIYNLENLSWSVYENVNLLKSGFQIKSWNSLSLGGEYTIARRQSKGNVSVNDDQINSIFRLYLIYHFKSTN